MGKFFTKGRIACLIIFSVLVIDQIIKIWIKTHMYWHESIRITDWFYIYFTENSGMAFGMEIFAKLFLTLFRIAAVTVIGWFLYKFVKQGMKTGFIICVSLVLTGACPSSGPAGPPSPEGEGNGCCWRQRKPPPTPAAGPRCGAGGSGCSTSGLTKPAQYRRNPGRCRGGSRR